jgi:hypothetical protein
VRQREDDLFEVLDQVHLLLFPDELHTVLHSEKEIVPPLGHPHEVETAHEIDDNFDGTRIVGGKPLIENGLECGADDIDAFLLVHRPIGRCDESQARRSRSVHPCDINPHKLNPRRIFVLWRVQLDSRTRPNHDHSFLNARTNTKPTTTNRSAEVSISHHLTPIGLSCSTDGLNGAPQARGACPC